MNEKPSVFTVRLLDLNAPFYEYIDRHSLKRSDALRYFIRQGISQKNTLSLKEREELKAEVISLKRELSSIGVNLNQIAHYFNIHTTFNDQLLHRNHDELRNKLKESSVLLNKILKEI